MSARLPATGGLLESLHAMGGTLGELVRVRGALFAVELREEIERRRHRLILATLAAGLLHMALLLVTLLVAMVFWDTHRLEAIGAMAAIYLACGIAAIVRLGITAGTSPAPFAATLGELDQDLAQMRLPP